MVAWKHYYCRLYLMVILYSHHYFESYELVFHCYARTSLTPHLLNTFYNSMDHIECNLLLPLIFCSNVPDVTSGSYSCVLSTYFHHLLVLPYFLAPQDVPLLHFIHIFPVLALESCISIRILVLFYWILVHRNQYPGTWHAHHYWRLLLLGLSALFPLGSIAWKSLYIHSLLLESNGIPLCTVATVHSTTLLCIIP